MNSHCLILGFPTGCGLSGVPEHPSLYVPEQWRACHVRAVCGPGPLRLQLPRRPLLLLREGQRPHVQVVPAGAVPDVASVAPYAGAHCGIREQGARMSLKPVPPGAAASLSSDGTPERAASGPDAGARGYWWEMLGHADLKYPSRGKLTAFGAPGRNGFKVHFVVPFRAG